MRPSIDVFVLGHETNIPPDLADVDWPASLKIIPTGARTLTDFVKSPAAPQLVDGDGELAALIVAADRELLRGVAIQAICLQGSACFVAIEQVDPDLPSTIDPRISSRRRTEREFSSPHARSMAQSSFAAAS